MAVDVGRVIDLFKYRRGRGHDDDEEYYPNGIRHRAMDERTPSGETVLGSIDPTYGTGIRNDIERSSANRDYNPDADMTRWRDVGEGDIVGRKRPLPISADEPAPNTANIIKPPDKPPVETVTETPSIIRKRPPIADAYDQAEGRYINAVNAPIQKQPLWKDILVAAAQTANNFFNPQQSKPVKLWGAMKHDKAVQEAGADLAPLEALYGKERQREAQDRQWANMERDDARAVAKDAGMTAAKKRADIIRQLNNLPEFDPADPDNTEMVAAMHDAGLPVVPKTAKTSFKYLTDAKTGKTFVDVSDAAGNRHLQEVVNDDGTPFAVTTPQMMTAADRKEQRELQERLAKERNITQIKVADIGARSRADVAGITTGAATTRADAHSADEAAKVLAAIRLNAPKGSTEEQIVQRQQQYLQTLRPEIRSKIPQ